MPGRIFVNYRRGDEPGFAGRLYDRLEAAFNPESLFMDVDNIAAGHDFVRVLEEEVGKCDVLLAIIGKGWIDAKDETGARRLDNPNDFVRIEIESGLKLGKRIIPVLVNNADMPRAEELPQSLRGLSRRNAVRLTHERFKADAQGLVKVLEGAIEEAEAARTAHSEAERRAVEQAALRKQEEEAARSAEAEQKAQLARRQASPGLGPEEIRKAEELANWDFIKTEPDATELRNHLARFPGGVTERYARAALEEVLWAALGASPTVEALDAFIAELPKGRRLAEAQAKRDELLKTAELLRAEEARRREETDAWADASSVDTLVRYQSFLRDWPQSVHAPAARSRIKELRRGTSDPSEGLQIEPVVGIVILVALIACVAALAYLSPTDTYSERRCIGYTDTQACRSQPGCSWDSKVHVCR